MLDLTEDQLDNIAERMTRKLLDEKRALWVDPETHSQHHEWIKDRLNDEAELKVMRKRVIESALIWAVILLLGFVGMSAWFYVKAAMTAPHP